VVKFLEQAADDPKVLAINRPFTAPAAIRGSRRADEGRANGKQVTAVVELRARFDEANNIQWARQLEEAGVHVVYGLVGYKIHAKMCLVVRRDDDRIRRYLHLATGNYNPPRRGYTPTSACSVAARRWGKMRPTCSIC